MGWKRRALSRGLPSSITTVLQGNKMVLLNQNNLKRLLVLAVLIAVAGCGSQPTIPVEEHSSVKSPPKREIYYRAAPVATPVVPKAASPVRQAPITYEAVEPDPVWREIPSPAQQPRSVEPAVVEQPYRVSPRTTTIEPVPRDEDPLQGMLQKIEQAMQQGAFERAEGLLERALRIDSQRPGLWHDLAQVRYQQHAYQEAVTLARRSNSFATPGSVLREENWSLIARAKEALGDLDGAAAAWRKAGR